MATLLLGVYGVSFCAPLYAKGYNGADGNGSRPTVAIPSDRPLVARKQPAPFKRQLTYIPKRDKAATIVNEDVYRSGKGYRISGPGQPEMSSFKSVGVDNMVNLFTGDFSYNIPLLDVGGYPVNIFYNAGITMDQEASWVGLGWNLNPGTVGRSLRGLPDDFDGASNIYDVITKQNYIKPNITVGLGASIKRELAGYSSNLGLNGTVSYNNYTGFGLDLGANASLEKSKARSTKDDKTDSSAALPFSLSGSVSIGSKTGLSISPTFSQQLFKTDKNGNSGALSTSFSYNSRSGLRDFQMDFQRVYHYKNDIDNSKIGVSGGFTLNFAQNAYTPSIRMPITYSSFGLHVQLGKESPVGFFKAASFDGFYSQSYVRDADRTITKPAFGYLNMQDANGNADALLDFNRLNDVGYIVGQTPAISIPQYTYDVFNISGEGTGGSFRAYRGDIGYVHDAYTKSGSIKGSAGVDLGAGTGAYNIGINLGGTTSKTFVGEWESDNLAKDSLTFRTASGSEEPVYFRNPGEMATSTQDYYNAIGDDRLVRMQLINTNDELPTATQNLVVYKKDGYTLARLPNNNIQALPLSGAVNSKATSRDKRSQVISYLTAIEAMKVGFDKVIRSYNPFDITNPFSCNGSFLSLNRTYRSGDEMVAGGETNYRQANHISEIDVVEQDGKRYVYGLPVYNVKQRDVTFAVNPAPIDGSELTAFGAGQNTLDGTAVADKSKDRYFSAEEIPAYAHSFLLTALLSPDYSDLTGDGITDDDMGTAVKFNYKRIGFINGRWNNYAWRTPAEPSLRQATYNQGLKTDNSDDKGFYSCGTKELWYGHSIESKSMVAVFTTVDRQDGLPTNRIPDIFGNPTNEVDEDGGVDYNDNPNSPSYINRVRLQRLDKIDLYAKADLIKNGANARPVKTVHFDYDYSLCGNVSNSAKIDPLNTSDKAPRMGKLTLIDIYFTYNGASISKKHKYVFRYNKSYNNKAFDYDRTAHDCWGNIKTAFNTTNSATTATPINPAGMANSDYQFAAQPSNASGTAGYAGTKNVLDAFAGAWNLSEVDLPSGATIKVGYESDDYAYVQNRQAAQMMKIAGFATGSTSSPIGQLYADGLLPVFPLTEITPGPDLGYVFFDVPEPVTSANPQGEINQKYLNGINQLLLKLYVKVPPDSYGNGFEPITVYSKIDGSQGNYTCGLANSYISGKPNTRIWVKLASVGGNPSVVETVFQFMRDHLGSKVYPGSDVRQEGAAMQVIESIIGMLGSISDLMGASNKFKLSGYGKKIDVSRSFARLTNPVGTKYGGGHRVKTIRITDNWDQLTTKTANGSSTNLPTPEFASEYGQEYDYTTTSTENGTTKTISSGVASNEPSSAGEENPFRELLQYNTTQLLGPTSYGAIEMPIAEGFYPTAMVGYSKVRVRSIHNRSVQNIKGGTGVQETEYYTTRDFPTLSDFSPLVTNESDRHFNPQAIDFFLKFFSLDYNTLSQGFRVQLNNMNGKIKQQSTYPENDPDHPVQYTKYHYRIDPVTNDPGTLYNKVDVVNGAKGDITNNATIGRDIELMVDFREHNSTSYSAKLNFNLEMQYPFIFIPSFYVPFSFDQSIFRSVSVMKVVNTYGILERVEAYDKGSRVNTDNLVYDAESGEPLVTSSTNTFNRPIYSLHYPAYWAYDGMGPAYKNIGVQYQHVFIRNGFIESGAVDQTLLQSGDEIYVDDASTVGVPDNYLCKAPNSCPPPLPISTASRVWAVDLSKDPTYTGTRRIMLLERDGTPYNGGDVYFRVVRSGRRNLLGASVGAMSGLVSPVVGNQITIPADNILNASAARFKEKWRSDEAFYVFDTVLTTTQWVHPKKITLPLLEVYNLKGQRSTGNDCCVFWDQHHYSSYFEAWAFNPSHNSDDYSAKSWLEFDISKMPNPENIVSSKLSLYSHTVANNLCNGYSSISHSDWVGGTSQSYIHDGNNSHVITYDSYPGSDGNNDSKLARMTLPWPGQDLGQWTRAYHNEDYIDNSTAILLQTNMNTLFGYDRYSNKSFAKGPNLDGRADITAMVKAMARDKTLNNRTVDGIRISLTGGPTPTNQMNMCFTGMGSCNSPTLDVYYLDCNMPPTDSQIDPSDPAMANTYPCSTTGPAHLCRSVFGQTKFNPYVYGMLGNWRAFKSYTFYDDRKESNVGSAPVPATDGTLKAFESFWAYDGASNSILPKNTEAVTASNKWVWNSAVAQVNRRGMEIENFDPLGRYNAGLYGYNQSLPVAVTNNSHYCESAFDGFEDYGFSDELCSTSCKPARHFDLGDIRTKLDNTQHHSGSYSLRVDAGTYQAISVPVKNYNGADPELGLGVKNSTIPVVKVELKGKGLTGSYFQNYSPNTIIKQHEEMPSVSIESWCSECKGSCNTHSSVPGFPLTDATNFTINWTGYLQVDRTGTYILNCPATDDRATVKIWEDGSSPIVNFTTAWGSGNPESFTVSLSAGTFYNISIFYQNDCGGGAFNILWTLPCYQAPIPIAKEYLYESKGIPPPPTYVPCAPDKIKMTGNILTDKFAPVPGSKMVFSAWVKEGISDCHCTNYANNSVQAYFNNDQSTALPTPLAPTGILIEGWQRYEGVIAVPQNAASMQVQLNNSGQSPAFFDDIRLHPFNANMKSFVYDPVTLRLRAELDENNYASFYEYDDEGTLTRVKKETREGIKTIQETRSALRQTQQ